LDIREHEESHPVSVKPLTCPPRGGPFQRVFMKNSSKPTQFKSQKVTTLKHRIAVQKALDMIQARIQNPPSLAELASLTGLSRTYFSRVFKGTTGMRLQEYLIQARINKAKDLLNDINLEIKQIAYEVGFNDPNHFSRTFKRKTGVSPTDWRLKEIKNPTSRL